MARKSFLLAVQAGALDDKLAEACVDAVKMCDVLVHQYVNIDVGLVAAAVPEVIERFDLYVRQIAAYSLQLAGGEQ